MLSKIAVIAFCIALLLLVFSGQLDQQKQKVADYVITPSIIPSPTPSELNADKIWSLVNSHRESLGLKPFIKNQDLCKIAQDRANEQNQLGYIDDHKGFKERYVMSYGLAENSTGPASTDIIAFEAWRHSDAHRKAMEGSWIYSCIATKGQFAEQIFSSFDKVNHNAIN